MNIRRGREFYSQHYEKVIALYNSGKSASEIAKQLGISYSAVYHWTHGLRKPEAGNLLEFQKFLQENGPSPAFEVKKNFPKHNELFLTARRRGLPVKRKILRRRFGEYALWYYMECQEKQLEELISELMKKYKEVRQKLVHALGTKKTQK
jgi:DNA-binding CsgD family transcriptional regulator